LCPHVELNFDPFFLIRVFIGIPAPNLILIALNSGIAIGNQTWDQSFGLKLVFVETAAFPGYGSMCCCCDGCRHDMPFVPTAQDLAVAKRMGQGS
jgi:hypothetical protein